MNARDRSRARSHVLSAEKVFSGIHVQTIDIDGYVHQGKKSGGKPKPKPKPKPRPRPGRG
jgi:hypothetical protein